MDKEIDDISADETSVTLKLALIQQRCSELLEGGDEFGGLSLEEPAGAPDNTNPYDRG